jgi:hypothetical protein
MDMHDSDSGIAIDDAAAASQVLDTAFAFWRATLLLSADEIGVFAALAGGPMDVRAISERLGIEREMAADLLNALVNLRFVERRGDRYQNTPTAARVLDPAQPAYLGRWLTMARATMRETADLTDRLRTAGPGGERAAQPSTRMWAEIGAILATEHA